MPPARKEFHACAERSETLNKLPWCNLTAESSQSADKDPTYGEPTSLIGCLGHPLRSNKINILHCDVCYFVAVVADVDGTLSEAR
jgi:hypothetical protein